MGLGWRDRVCGYVLLEWKKEGLDVFRLGGSWSVVSMEEMEEPKFGEVRGPSGRKGEDESLRVGEISDHKGAAVPSLGTLAVTEKRGFFTERVPRPLPSPSVSRCPSYGLDWIIANKRKNKIWKRRRIMDCRVAMEGKKEWQVEGENVWRLLKSRSYVNKGENHH